MARPAANGQFQLAVTTVSRCRRLNGCSATGLGVLLDWPDEEIEEHLFVACHAVRCANHLRQNLRPAQRAAARQGTALVSPAPGGDADVLAGTGTSMDASSQAKGGGEAVVQSCLVR